MATGTGKTYTTFQIIWRLWKAGVVKRALFLVDRNILVDQALINDFKPFAGAMTKVTGHKFDPAYEIHLALYHYGKLRGRQGLQKALTWFLRSHRHRRVSARERCRRRPMA
jgi:type I restriction enzyme R subunit